MLALTYVLFFHEKKEQKAKERMKFERIREEENEQLSIITKARTNKGWKIDPGVDPTFYGMRQEIKQKTQLKAENLSVIFNDCIWMFLLRCAELRVVYFFN